MKSRSRSKPIITRKLVIYLAVFAVLVAALAFVNAQSNVASSDNVYGVPASQLSDATRKTLDDPNYQNIVLPEQLDQRIANKDSFFVYFFSSTCPYCMETTPKLNPIIAEAGVDVPQFNLEVYQDGFSKYNIVYTPTLVYYEDGVEKDRIEGGLVDGNDINTEKTFKDFFEKYKDKTTS
ncbi:thioredoxin family protein [Paenibacillus alkalitolerans]|uniref:thioredoxin family protein n=1 Tax=Paenibacillus alkalitolerans TaxID=2799335 RepID=UPI0018F31E90|nr:thioredoxin family protein [Paenibacillus alkalitolerans]